MKAEDVKPITEIYSRIKGTDFQRYYQSFDKSNPQYQHILPVQKQTYEVQKALSMQTLQRPGNIGVMLKNQVQFYSVHIQSERCPNRYIFADLMMGYEPAPDCYIEFGRLWAFCDLFIEFYEIQQAYQAGNTITGFSIGIDRSKLPAIFDDLKGCGYIAKNSDYRNFETIFTPLPLPIVTRVRWVKKNKRNRDTAKKALIDMLRLMGVPADQITDKKRLKACFDDDDGQPLTYTSSNFYNSKEYFRHHSEYYPELQKIIIG
jgi:hypothetical protein